MNELNETLRVIRTQKAKLNTELKNETNRKKNDGVKKQYQYVS